MFAGKELSAPPESGGDFIGDKQHIALVAETADPTQIFRMIKTHAPCPLDYGLQDHRRQFVAMAFDQLGKGGDIGLVPLIVKPGLGPVGKKIEGQISGKDMVHAGHGIADGHGMKGVAVVAGA